MQIDAIKEAARLFYLDTGRYPSEQEGLAALMASPADASAWQGPYLDSQNPLRDPWGRAYLYDENTGTEGPVIRSPGRDGAVGGTGEDTDLPS
ncbi:type II secretion system protein GspG [Pontivivens nitratireducens]|uniref:Type II secretion system protein GspG C-terminal domain-containing protein n=1 Tax=Pontivivens nitratireducens TaxID=2758038 RepID=A0A6G7VI19_9RHOB|nr:type II secretion system protein GspG [Pontibrevibacter nitratireducens]QIK39743.1 hypothetical protein G8E03_02555 [Pontibrevibacter nitratireducens]